MNKTDELQAPGRLTRMDSISCGVVLASILVTMACGAFVIDTAPDSPPHYAQADMEATHD